MWTRRLFVFVPSFVVVAFLVPAAVNSFSADTGVLRRPTTKHRGTNRSRDSSARDSSGRTNTISHEKIAETSFVRGRRTSSKLMATDRRRQGQTRADFDYYDDGDEYDDYDENDKSDDYEFDYYDTANDNDDRNRYRNRSRDGNVNRDQYEYSYDDGNNDDDVAPSEAPDSNKRGGMYKVYFDGTVDPSEVQPEWESCASPDGKLQAQVLLPPASTERPSVVVHFVGGTFFGSAPRALYGTFLEGLVQNTQCAVVATPIPVTMRKNPLRHVELCKRLQRSFEYAWDAVIVDEYGEQQLEDVKCCGIGHSLGSRLLVVLETLKMRQPDASTAQCPSYSSLVLVSFTNYGASAGIPGIAALMNKSKSDERSATVSDERERLRRSAKAKREPFDDSFYDSSRRRRPRGRGEQSGAGDRYGSNGDDGYGNSYDRYSEYDDEDELVWDEFVEEVQGAVKEQTSRVRKALTPKLDDLEFHPTPDQLWNALSKDGRYSVPQTLLVQFDDDAIDQSAKLARVLQETNSTSIKYARLRGDHLSPVSLNGGSATAEQNRGQRNIVTTASQRLGQILGNRIDRGTGSGSSSATAKGNFALTELRRSVSRYLIDIVAKPDA